MGVHRHVANLIDQQKPGHAVEFKLFLVAPIPSFHHGISLPICYSIKFGGFLSKVVRELTSNHTAPVMLLCTHIDPVFSESVVFRYMLSLLRNRPLVTLPGTQGYRQKLLTKHCEVGIIEMKIPTKWILRMLHLPLAGESPHGKERV